jgi:ribulose-phosphate 3-epimerase
MVSIIPAVLPASFQELEQALTQVQGAAALVQIDVVDGVFAPNTTWPYTDKASFERVSSGEEGMPLWESFDFEFDLMIADPLPEVMRYVQVGASRIILHTKSAHVQETLQVLSEARANGEFPISIGLALAPDEGVEVLAPYKGSFDFVQVMGIERVGFQGQPFSSQSLSLVQKVRETYPELPVQVDGAVSMENVRALCDAGATELVVGSAVFSAENSHEAIAALTKAANAV